MKFFIFALLFPILSFAQELKVFSWNTYLIPPPWNMTKQSARTKVMVEVLPQIQTDVMLFQETFFDKKRNDLIRALKKTHPYVAVPVKGRKLTQLQDSGLFIASKYPMIVLDQVIFKKCAKADCISSKSAIMVEITLPNEKKVQLVNTHLQAWDEPKTIAIRRAQLDQIKEMMNKYNAPGVPQFLIGDLNIDGNTTTEYPGSLEFMEMSSTPMTGETLTTNGFSTQDCFKKPGDNNPQWLDHVWMKQNGSTAEVVAKEVNTMVNILNGFKCPLSDHYALEATIRL